MTITATFALQNVPINADTVRQAISSLLPNGGGLIQSGDFQVTQTGTPSMGVSVGVGRAWIQGNGLANLSGQLYGKQGQYFILNDAPVTVSIATSDPTNPRIDVIYMAVQDAAYSGANNQSVLAVATGVPTSGASYPANAQALPSNSLALAYVTVPANASSITTSNITTLQNQIISPQPAFIHAEFTCVPNIPQNSLYNLGPLTLDTANSNGSGIITSPSQGIIQLATPGIYAMSVALVNFTAAASGTGSYMLIQTPDTAHTYARSNMPTGTLGLTTESPNVYVPTANFQVAAQVIQTFTGTLNAACRVRVTKIR